MVKIEIEISELLAVAFQEAVTYYNTKHETTYTPKQVVKYLARRFTIDTLRAARIETANEAAEEELKDL